MDDSDAESLLEGGRALLSQHYFPGAQVVLWDSPHAQTDDARKLCDIFHVPHDDIREKTYCICVGDESAVGLVKDAMRNRTDSLESEALEHLRRIAQFRVYVESVILGNLQNHYTNPDFQKDTFQSTLRKALAEHLLRQKAYDILNEIFIMLLHERNTEI